MLDAVNVALRLSVASYKGFELHGVVEKRDGKTHRVMIAAGAVFALSGVAAVAVAGFIGKPTLSREERIVLLMESDDRIADIAHALAVRPLTWAALNRAYETVCGVMSDKKNPGKARSDFGNLVAKGWLTSNEADRFYDTAAYYRKGYPRSPNRSANPMPHGDACALIDRLLWRLVDEHQPS